jgi:glycosyltransferase involved in cell wall biosynthesis
MHIAIEASTWVNQRGYGRFTRELARALLRCGGAHRFTLILDSGAARASDLPDAGRLTVDTRESVTEAAVQGSARRPFDLARMSWRVSRAAFDWVVFPTVYSFVPVFGRAKLAVTIHDALPEMFSPQVLGSRIDAALWRAKVRLAIRQATLLMTTSTAAAADIRRHLPVGDRRIAMLSAGVAEAFTPQPAIADGERVRALVPDGRLVVYVGGLSPHKRVPALIAAFGHVAARHADARLVLAGPADEDGFSRDEGSIRAAIAGLGTAADRVHQVGFVPDDTLAALYRAATCVVLPSIVEGFGLPALEAMACGAPVLVARTPALVELCGDAAATFDAPEDLPAALLQLFESDAARDRLRRAAPARAALFGWEEAARRLLAALDHPPDW